MWSGNKIKVSVFGESHGCAIGTVIENFPSGSVIDLDKLQNFLARRSGGGSLTTPRKESDIPEFLSGVRISDNRLLIEGTPVCAVIRNLNTRSADYSEILNTPRPSHSDFTAFAKFRGKADMRGGGHFSGRLTAPVCIAGGIALQILEQKKITVNAKIVSIGKVAGTTEEMLSEVEKARNKNDSVGGVIECTVEGVPAGIGGLMFEGLESRISSAIFGIPAVKGIEFGSGFYGTTLPGSENNDGFYLKDGVVKTYTNNHGGILGGISSGMPIVFRTAFKPTPSIGLEQKTVNLKTGENAKVTIKGRHDPCVVLRAVPAVEAVTALVMLDNIIC
jgi:chorismate synthase